MNRTTPVRVGAWNAGDGPDRVKARDLARIGAECDLLALAEFGDRADVDPAEGMSRWHGHWPGAPSTPIDYRPELFAPYTLRFGCELLTGPRRVGDAGPGPAVTKPKVVNWLRGQLAGNGRWLRFASVHLVPAPHINAAREHLGHAQIRALSDLVASWRGDGLLVLAGDFNRNPDDRDLDLLESTGLEVVSTGPTHGRDTYDLILARRRDRGDLRVPSLEARVLSGGSSDHDVPWVELEVARR